MARWRVRLQGETFDLEDLPGMFTSPDLRVVVEEGAHYLESSTFDALDGPAEVRDEALRVLSMINGVARLQWRSFRNVDAGSDVIELTPEGPKGHKVIAAGTAESRAKAYAPAIKLGDDEPQAPPPGFRETDKWLELAAKDSDVAEALVIWGTKPHDWVNFYKVFEIIASRADIKKSRWATDNELSRFTRTAQHPEAAGDEARHARTRQEPPPKPMTPSEGDAFIERLHLEWLRSLSGS